MLLFKNFKPVEENLLVRSLKARYLWKLKLCLKYRKTTCVVMAVLDRRHRLLDPAAWHVSSCPSWRRATSGSAASARST